MAEGESVADICREGLHSSLLSVWNGVHHQETGNGECLYTLSMHSLLHAYM